MNLQLLITEVFVSVMGVSVLNVVQAASKTPRLV